MKKSIVGIAALAGGVALVCKNRKDYYKKYNILPEYRTIFRFTFKKYMINKTCMDFMNKGLENKISYPAGVTLCTRTIPTYDGTKIQVHIMEPENVAEDEVLPCLVYYHGGAYVMDLSASYFDLVSNYVKQARCKVVMPNYRTLYKATADACFEDAYSTLVWTYENADILHIDKERIAVGGDSAGGGLTAAVTHMTRDRKGPKVCFQMMIYPAVDDSLSTESMKKYTDSPIWNARANRKMWNEVKKSLSSEMERYASSLSNKNFTGLCNGYIEVEEFDCLHDEGKLYAEKLMENGYEVELNDVKGTFHGYDQSNGKLFGKQIIELRSDRLRKAFLKEN